MVVSVAAETELSPPHHPYIQTVEMILLPANAFHHYLSLHIQTRTPQIPIKTHQQQIISKKLTHRSRKMPSEIAIDLPFKSFFNCISSCFRHHSSTAIASEESIGVDSSSPAQKQTCSIIGTNFSGDSESCCCPICLMEFDESKKILPNCGHVFHKECIDKWIPSLSLNCPICRVEDVVDEKMIGKTGHRVRNELLDPFEALALQFQFSCGSAAVPRFSSCIN
ncbi:hypothetical protein M9H77_05302 [Catharanthus roseus]|uniref:Uncharacterized protein n=1 Tax=Catharanthus roseus TaxID=4058 RepID=A0ACC0CGY8_CATRO|nr:hypothetical protein M9H77_05302 [Catharanthus roseus]